ncbi:glycosyltransferase family 4 protein [Luteolibacter marinus]|uniref:glycosyltransferase family 4 protein n=1 Tax=Luteolibacter marinus TaxID=2776705 RepID=UPI001868E1F9|nr:glycosyltransferase family 4 protein [Luteolibacter marinus]
MRVLISAFVCEPLEGSEPEVGWRWAMEMARHAEVVVVTQRKNRARIERYLADHPDEAERVEFRYHAPGMGLERLRKRLRLGYFTLWQWTLRGVMERWLAEDPGIGLIHHVTFASFRYPCFLGGLGVPVVWGPVGGADEAPEGLLAYRGRQRARLKERLRNGLTGVSRLLLPWLDPTGGGRSGIVLAATPSMARVLEGEGLCCETFPTIGMTDEEWHQAEPLAGVREPGPMRFLYVGRLHFLKGIHLLLEAVAGLTGREFELTLVGGGPEDGWLRGLAKEFGVAERVRFMGPVPRGELPEWYRRHDVIVSPSLYESGGLATLEAMNHGLPAIVLDVGGHQLSVTRDCGIRVDPHGPGHEVVARLRDALRTYLDRPELAVLHGAAARRRVAERYLWSRKAESMLAIYRRVLADAAVADGTPARIVESECRQ